MALEGFKTRNIAISGQFKTSGHINADCVKKIPPGAQGCSGATARLLSYVQSCKAHVNSRTC